MIIKAYSFNSDYLSSMYFVIFIFSFVDFIHNVFYLKFISFSLIFINNLFIFRHLNKEKFNKNWLWVSFRYSGSYWMIFSYKSLFLLFFFKCKMCFTKFDLIFSSFFNVGLFVLIRMNKERKKETILFYFYYWSLIQICMAQWLLVFQL